MASYGRDTDDVKAQRSKESTVVGEKNEQAQCTTLYVGDSIKERCSQRLRSILGVLPCSILRV
jgi:hypothetical protein